VKAAIRIVEELLRIDREAAERFDRGVVTGVHLRDGKPTRQAAPYRGDAAGRVQRLAGVAAVPEHVEAAVPRRRKADLEANLGLNLSNHAAVFGCVGRRRDRRCRHDRELIAGLRDQRCARRTRPESNVLRECSGLPVPELRTILRGGAASTGRDRDCQHESSDPPPRHHVHRASVIVLTLAMVSISRIAASAPAAGASGSARAAHDRNFAASSSSLAGRSG
jgi:hypothetical protein